jgi:hypothetical protein
MQDFLAFQLKQGPFHNMLDPNDQKCSTHDWWAFEGACRKLIAPMTRKILGQTVSLSSCKHNWSNYSFVHNKSLNRLQPKKVEDLVYVYTNSRLMTERKEKDEKKWSVDNACLEDSNFALEEDVEVYSDPDLDGWDDGNLRVQNSDGKMNCSPFASNQNHVRDLEDEYNFQLFMMMEMITTTKRICHL